MSPLYLAWTAIAANFWVFLTPQAYATSLSALLTIIVLHSIACAVFATATYLLLPLRYRTPRFPVWLLMWLFAFIAPLAGPVCMILITHLTLHHERDRRHLATPESLEALEFTVHSKNATRSTQGAIRSRLSEQVPSQVRMQSLLSLQAVPARVANPLLEDLLGDASDDVRLVAFGMLETEEKKLTVHIHRERQQLESDLTPDQRYTSLRHLAELHWEMTYTALAQGEMRRYMLAEARRYIEEAMSLRADHDAGLVFLRARILLAQGENDSAEHSIQLAAALGQPEPSTLPYLAEMAFRRRDFALTRECMTRLSRYHVASRIKACADLWTGRERLELYRDRSILHHI